MCDHDITPDLTRLLGKVKITRRGCWLWQGALNTTGYGIIKFRGSCWLAHRASFVLHGGRLTNGLVLHHICDTPACVNPAHIRQVTHRFNVVVGRGPSAQNARKSVCRRGHAFDRVLITRHGVRRQCRTCKRQADARLRAMRQKLKFSTGAVRPKKRRLP